MMLGKGGRGLVKQALGFTKVKLVYMRVTLTRYTTLYFFFALLTCLVLSVLQGVILADNAQATGILSKIVLDGNVKGRIAMIMDGHLQVCDGVPGQHGTNCTMLSELEEEKHTTNAKRSGIFSEVLSKRNDDEEGDGDGYGGDGDKEEDHEDKPISQRPSIPAGSSTIVLQGKGGVITGGESKVEAASDATIDMTCLYSLSWLNDVLQDSQREDVVTLLYQVWMFTLAMMTVINESLPHLGAGLLGHILGAAWASSRIPSTRDLMHTYRDIIVPGPCQGVDVLGNWWEMRMSHTIPIVVLNALTLVALTFLSVKLFKVYATQSFSRVGASAAIHRMYKLVLFFSVCLQLTGFFSLASTAMWINKIAQGNLKSFAKHGTLYLAAFILTLILELPWAVLGWVCVRRECRVRFWFFLSISFVLVGISTLMFSSLLYRCIFVSWSFFATITVTAYILVALSTILGILCRLNFGKGLAHYLQVSEALEGVDFTPVYFPRLNDAGIVEKEDGDMQSLRDNKILLASHSFPTLPYSKPKKGRGPSVYSEIDGNPIVVSSSPPLVSELAARPARLSKIVAHIHARNSTKMAGANNTLQLNGKSSLVKPVGRILSPSGRQRDPEAYSPSRVSAHLPDNSHSGGIASTKF